MPIDEKAGFTALNRFGFGARQDAGVAAAASDPRGYLESELRQPGAALLDDPSLESSAPLLARWFEAHRASSPGAARRKGEMEASRDMDPALPRTGQTEPPAAPAKRAQAAGDSGPAALVQNAIFSEALARFKRAATAPAGFVERLVCFWSNHFCISTKKGGAVAIIAGAYEREAIRPHVLGRFADMLKAAEQHPAMVMYLDNMFSIGPDSPVGRRRNFGLNENLAREIMELHTLGVNGGYTQADVVALARIITGWTVVRGPAGGVVGEAKFEPNYHQPGAQTVLGKSYGQTGREQGFAAFEDIARRPATARHIASKFARHFVADEPPPGLVDRLAQVFTRTDGDLRELALALIRSDEAWAAPATKLRTPYEFLVSAARATGQTPADPRPIMGGLTALGQPLWGPPAPDGYPDSSAALVSPEAMQARLDAAWWIASHAPNLPDPTRTLDRIAGAAARPETRQTVARAESRQQGLALFLMSPEMQRR